MSGATRSSLAAGWRLEPHRREVLERGGLPAARQVALAAAGQHEATPQVGHERLEGGQLIEPERLAKLRPLKVVMRSSEAASTGDTVLH